MEHLCHNYRLFPTTFFPLSLIPSGLNKEMVINTNLTLIFSIHDHHKTMPQEHARKQEFPWSESLKTDLNLLMSNGTKFYFLFYTPMYYFQYFRLFLIVVDV